ncbi:hypothetical protein D5086_004424 [Populus alba]|uniref:Uncharacterized protein n=1 Tax=Populus alba TaxID=43335 RepID=A0ACC4CQC4_POPAL
MVHSESGALRDHGSEHHLTAKYYSLLLKLATVWDGKNNYLLIHVNVGDNSEIPADEITGNSTGSWRFSSLRHLSVLKTDTSKNS